MADTPASKVVALPAIVDLDTLDVVRDGLIDAVEMGAVTVDASKVERVATNALFMLISAAEIVAAEQLSLCHFRGQCAHARRGRPPRSARQLRQFDERITAHARSDGR